MFWLAKLSQIELKDTTHYADILHSLLKHPDATVISKAKVLEIPEERFGMSDLREEYLRAGNSDWLGWSSAIGCCNEAKGKRNQMLNYFSHASPMNKLIADCVKRLS